MGKSWNPADLLVVLRDTGQRGEDGLPVLLPDEGAGPVAEALLRGFSGRLLRLYRMIQERLCRQGEGGPEPEPEVEPEPAYLVLSSNDGGFARSGFYLGAQKNSHTWYVDLKRGGPLTGAWGAVDQIFPHELGHVIMRRLAGRFPPGGANQVHAVPVRTDPSLAFDEGFAEHLQVMAMDDPDAAQDTKALARDPAPPRFMDEQLDGYCRELAGCRADATEAEAGPVPVPAGGFMRRFPMWFGRVEQIQRYHAVKENRFARDPVLPDGLLDTPDPYSAYLAENIVPGGPGGRPRAPARAFFTEGFVSTFFVRLISRHEVRRDRPGGAAAGEEVPGGAAAGEEERRARLGGVAGGGLSPLENAYLKVFHVLNAARPRSLEGFVAAYRAAFPEEAAALDTLLRELLHGQEHRPAPAIWLANPWFSTGTSVFDQYRCVPRPHTFDLNAASLADLVGVPGIDRDLARRIVELAPFESLSQLECVPGISGGVLRRFGEMAAIMPGTLASPEEIEAAFLSSLPLILRSFGIA